MRYWICLFLLSGLLTGAAIAQETVLRSLQTGDDADPWQAVGRLDIAGRSFCTGALIEPNIVLTAAHCIYDKDTGTLIDHRVIEFRAGWRNGRASAYRQVRRMAAHPDYVNDGEVSSRRVRNDLALLELAHPINNTTVAPFKTAGKPRRGARVGVVSYGRDRSDVPSLQEVCEVLAHQGGVMVTSCSVDFGSSGAPIFSFEDGEARIVSVVSAKSEMEDGRRIALGTDLKTPLQHLKLQLDANAAPYQNAVPTVSRVVVGEGRNRMGAKFIRPQE